MYLGGNPGLGFAYTTNGAGSGSNGDSAFQLFNPAAYSKLQFQAECQGNWNATNVICWFAVQQGGNWYVCTNAPLSNQGYGGGSNFWPATLTYNPAATNWVKLNLGASSVSLGSTSASNLSGVISGVGIVMQLGAGAGSWNFNRFAITLQPYFAYVGACMSDYPRLELIPGRTFMNFAGQPVDAFNFLATNGFNAIRAFVTCGDPLVSPPVNNTNVNYREANYLLDWGGIDWQVNLARQAKARGMHLVLTVQLGQIQDDTNNWNGFIPTNWLGYTYPQMLAAVDSAVRQALDPFLAAGIQPDILNLGNEENSGQLFQYAGPNQEDIQRNSPPTGTNDLTATGFYSIWAKCAGIWKQEIISAKSELGNYGFNPALTRFSVHGGDPLWLFNLVFNNAAVFGVTNAEQHCYSNNVDLGAWSTNVIPAEY